MRSRPSVRGETSRPCSSRHLPTTRDASLLANDLPLPRIAARDLLGFAATDFVITKTLSAADAAEHLVKNPLWPWPLYKGRQQLAITMLLLVLLGAMFLRGFREVIGLAVVIVGVYLALNAFILAS